MKYKTDWRDELRHVANFGFIGCYLAMERGHLAVGAVFTIVSELLLLPSALRHRSWSTILVGAIFLALACGTLSRSSLGG